MRCLMAGFAVWLMGCQVCLTADLSSVTTPVPPDRLTGRRLHFRLVEASIEAPDDSWAFLEVVQPKSKFENYICVNSSQGNMFLLSTERVRERLDDGNIGLFLKGGRKTVEKMGGKMSEPVCARSDIPQPGPSYRYHCTVTHPDGLEAPVITYVAESAGWVFSLTTYEKSETESMEFRRFVKSLRLPKPEPERESSLLYVSIGLMAWLLGLVVRALLWKRPRLQYEIALFAVVGMLVLRLAVLLGSAIPQDQISEALGYEVGLAFLPMAVLIWLVFRKQPEEVKTRTVAGQPPTDPSETQQADPS